MPQSSLFLTGNSKNYVITIMMFHTSGLPGNFNFVWNKSASGNSLLSSEQNGTCNRMSPSPGFCVQ
jgi:hypothetical protein